MTRLYAVTKNKKKLTCTWSHGTKSAILDGKKRGTLHCGIEKKGKSSLTGWKSFVFESTAFFCHPAVWWMLYNVNGRKMQSNAKGRTPSFYSEEHFIQLFFPNVLIINRLMFFYYYGRQYGIYMVLLKTGSLYKYEIAEI